MNESVMIIHDCRFAAESLAFALASIGHLDVAGIIDTSRTADAIREAGRCDVVLIGVHGDSKTVARVSGIITGANKSTKVIVLGIPATTPNLSEFISIGVQGYVANATPLDELIVIIRRVVSEGWACSSHFAYALFCDLEERGREITAAANGSVLTIREIEVSKLLAKNLDNREIADRLCLSLHTVKNHVHNILKKMGVAKRFEAAALAGQGLR